MALELGYPADAGAAGAGRALLVARPGDAKEFGHRVRQHNARDPHDALTRRSSTDRSATPGFSLGKPKEAEAAFSAALAAPKPDYADAASGHRDTGGPGVRRRGAPGRSSMHGRSRGRTRRRRRRWLKAQLPVLPKANPIGGRPCSDAEQCAGGEARFSLQGRHGTCAFRCSSARAISAKQAAQVGAIANSREQHGSSRVTSSRRRCVADASATFQRSRRRSARRSQAADCTTFAPAVSARRRDRVSPSRQLT